MAARFNEANKPVGETSSNGMSVTLFTRKREDTLPVLKRDESLIQRAKERFNATTLHFLSGFMLPDGTMLSIYKGNAAFVIRAGHSNIDGILSQKELEESKHDNYANGFDYFMAKTGSLLMRVMGEGFNISDFFIKDGWKPTPEQLRAIKESITTEVNRSAVLYEPATLSFGVEEKKNGRVVCQFRFSPVRPNDVNKIAAYFDGHSVEG